MFASVRPQSRSLGAQDQCDALRTERILELRVRVARKPDPPEAGRADFLKGPRKVDDPHPWDPLERSRGRLCNHSALGRRMAILGDDPDRSECGGGSQDRSDIVWIGDLIEHQQYRAFGRLVKEAVEPGIVEWLDLDDHALVRSIVRDEAGKIVNVGECYGDVGRKLHEAGGFTRGPGAKHLALRVIERSGNGMLAPEPRTVRRSMSLMASFAPRHGAPMRARQPVRNSLLGRLDDIGSIAPAVPPPGSDRENQEDGIAPQRDGGAISERHEALVDRLHRVGGAGGELESRDP